MNASKGLWSLHLERLFTGAVLPLGETIENRVNDNTHFSSN